MRDKIRLGFLGWTTEDDYQTKETVTTEQVPRRYGGGEGKVVTRDNRGLGTHTIVKYDKYGNPYDTETNQSSGWIHPFVLGRLENPSEEIVHTLQAWEGIARIYEQGAEGYPTSIVERAGLLIDKHLAVHSGEPIAFGLTEKQKNQAQKRATRRDAELQPWEMFYCGFMGEVVTSAMETITQASEATAQLIGRLAQSDIPPEYRDPAIEMLFSEAGYSNYHQVARDMLGLAKPIQTIASLIGQNIGRRTKDFILKGPGI
jgi:hypothetical protein